MSQKLVIIGQEGSCLFRLHAQSSAQRIQNELKRTLSLAWIPLSIHLHDVYSILDWFSLRGLQSSSATRSVHIIDILKARLVKLSVILAVVIKVEDVLVHGDTFHVPLNSGE
jgi:hypothetical protein